MARHSTHGPPGRPAGAMPHFQAHRPDHKPPSTLSDAELAHAIDSLTRKLYSARRMLAVATTARLTLYALIVIFGIAILTLIPVPFRELAEGYRALATTWDIFAWWFALVAIASVLGAVAVQASRRRRRRAAGWRARVEELERRRDEAVQEQKARLRG